MPSTCLIDKPDVTDITLKSVMIKIQECHKFTNCKLQLIIREHPKTFPEAIVQLHRVNVT